MTNVAWLLFGLCALALATQRWVWVLGFVLGALASFFAMLASIIHFQILSAIGFMVLMMAFLGMVSVLG